MSNIADFGVAARGGIPESWNTSQFTHGYGDPQYLNLGKKPTIPIFHLRIPTTCLVPAQPGCIIYIVLVIPTLENPVLVIHIDVNLFWLVCRIA